MAYYDWVKSFYPNPKIICCVRDLRSIFASMEKLYRKNPNRAAFGEDPGKMQFLTVDTRVAYWMSNPPIGLGLARLADAIQRKTADNFHFVRFEDLTSNGTAELDKIYEFIGEPRFEHDLYKVEQKTHEDDSIYGISDLHLIRREVKPVKPDWNDVLGKELSQLITIKYKWFYDKFYAE
jgi:sulfotransferase